MFLKACENTQNLSLKTVSIWHRQKGIKDEIRGWQKATYCVGDRKIILMEQNIGDLKIDLQQDLTN